MKRLNYAFWIVMTLPFAFLGVVTAIFEMMLRTSGDFTIWVVRPFTWAYERKCGAWNAMGDGRKPKEEGSHHVDG
jgi:hypothetical protein